ncbi:MAG: PAS domain-containing sensor histidine kinase [Proteobacteria bacterium]|nr:PAS domain-containing sensor histidine kinase [Pseudomonadota bacterium]
MMSKNKSLKKGTWRFFIKKPIIFFLSYLKLYKTFSRDRLIALTLGLGVCVLGILTFTALRDPEFLTLNVQHVFALLLADFIFLALIVLVIARRLTILWAEHKKGLAGSHLHVRLVLLFGLISAIPAILVAIFSGLFFHYGIESWFSTHVKTALDESSAVAQAYLKEHQKSIATDASLMARDVSRNLTDLLNDSIKFNDYLSFMTTLRSLREAVVFDEAHNVLARSNFSFSLEFEPVSQLAVDQARRGEISILTGENSDRVRAIIQIDSLNPTLGPLYLYVGRHVDPHVLGKVIQAEGAISEYKILEQNQSNFQITFFLIFAAVALLLLLMAIWVGLLVATQIVRPISYLIDASRQVGSGNLSFRIPEKRSIAHEGEISKLIHTFNIMTSKLELQQSELKEASQQIELRRQFTESVLSNVSAGIIGLDSKAKINLANSSASLLLETQLENQINQPILKVFPEISNLLEKKMSETHPQLLESQVHINRGGHTRTFLVRISSQNAQKEKNKGFVLTFDDLTEQLSDQRKAAWSDVARRIAHEIKNPLTPIQLSAERLRRKYASQITTDSESFLRCVDTIMRQVETIGSLVSEFSAFARMPAPIMKQENLIDICHQAVLLQQNAHPYITYKVNFPKKPLILECDAQQLMQTLTNLLKNAAESIDEKLLTLQNKPHLEETESSEPEQITLHLSQESDGIVKLDIIDTGSGLPKAGRERLTEPYYTTRAQGTGLGLAIVKKIMQDHHGALELKDREDGLGAHVKLLFFPHT